MHESASQTDVWSASYVLFLVKQRTDDRTDGRTDGWTRALARSANAFSQIKNRFFIWLGGFVLTPLSQIKNRFVNWEKGL